MLQVGEPDPNRDKQFENIKRECEKFKKTGDPILSGDTKKEIIGNNKNNGTEWRKEKDPRPVDDHDFSNAPKLIPYGLFDTQRQRGFVNCTTSHDTPEFVYNTINPKLA